MKSKTIIISNAKYAEVISTDEIVYCKAEGSYTEILLSNKEKITASKNLHWFEEKCSKNSFCRVHKSFLVNLHFICRVFHVKNHLLLKNKILLPVSRIRKNVLLEKLEQMNELA